MACLFTSFSFTNSHGTFQLAVLILIHVFTILASPPNIIFILADDLGWDDVSFHGAEFPTPNIDRLALDGVILNNYYVQPMCTPTRGAILTGKYPIHTGLQHYVITGSQPYGLPLTEITLAQHLQTLGYVTRAIGKWHLGFCKEDYLPGKRGFDSHYGYYLGRGDHFDHYAQDRGFMGLDLHDNNQPVWNETEVYSTDLFTAKALDTIRGHNKTKPLFLYLAYQAVHAGNDYDTIQAPLKYVNRFPYIKDVKRKMFAGMASALDDAVGEVYKALQENGLAENSIIIFSTDNGGPANGYDGNAACNWPLRGTKNTLWQGGVRGVGFVHSPLLKKKSYVNNNLMHAVDWMPTLLGLAKGDLTKLDNIDGFDQWETISENAESERKEVLLNIDPIMQHESLIIAQYKIIFGNISDGKNDGWYPPSGTNILSANSSSSSLNYEKNNESNIKFISSLNIQDMTQTEVKNLIDILDFINERLRNNLTMNDVLIDLLPTINEMMNAPQIFFSRVHKKEEMATKKKAEINSLDLVVNCGIRPTNASTNCQPLKAPCLFDIENDPCEYNNIADHLPVIVEVLTQRLRMYESTMIPPANKPIDPKGDPSLHGGVWGPWL
ncbi:arylsulfatase J [Biomphalaria glabrata]|nr:arylsulfatase J [Biomphalaria glabrata]